ncbi:hypothetical protein WR25_12370 [Diploscapter pachys]|uniref:Uncharacterized protein n=1 Tax=Diploscapter pachys TaxID=2018661 RepID=A0A2A2J9G4_9BILA|nr:hypothetical protein WR25_12370 [Diploscapter pachys]
MQKMQAREGKARQYANRCLIFSPFRDPKNEICWGRISRERGRDAGRGRGRWRGTYDRQPGRAIQRYRQGMKTLDGHCYMNDNTRRRE